MEPPCIEINEEKIEHQLSVTYLGLQVDDDLNWRNRINFVSASLSSSSYLMSQNELCVLWLAYLAEVHVEIFKEHNTLTFPSCLIECRQSRSPVQEETVPNDRASAALRWLCSSRVVSHSLWRSWTQSAVNHRSQGQPLCISDNRTSQPVSPSRELAAAFRISDDNDISHTKNLYRFTWNFLHMFVLPHRWPLRKAVNISQHNRS
ncbi:hypothetical protein J6590_006389 [Homalodisca vitripennis]|nr:hypothetical protein J6590_006389 [Homalodisca vitripennis]